MKTKKYSKSAFTMLLLLFSIASAFATNYYVDANNGNNSNNGLLSTTAKRSIQAAANLTNPGDTVFIMNGIYNPTGDSNSGFQSILTIVRSGTAANYITYKNYPGHTPKLQLLIGLSYQVWRAIAIDASYIKIDGLEIEGTNQSLNYAGAYQTWQDYENNIKNWNKISMYNCGSVSVGDKADVHHIEVRNCKIHDTGGGIGGFSCDYVTIENNVVYNTCWYSMYAGSGISILDPKSIDAVTGYKIYIRNNVVHNNKTLIPWERTNALSDGNGIILDVNIGNGTTTFPYVGRYLVENNVSYNNGGGGVHAYKCAHVDIINNTAYNNGTIVGYPEIDASNSTDVKIYNNIMYGRGTGTNLNGNDAGAIYDYNIYFNGTSYKNGPNDRTVDPKFVNVAIDATANFRLLNSSPAINNGNNISGLFALKDILGISRPVGFTSDIGAYEYGTVISRAEMNVKQAATDITDNSGTFDFGSVSSTVPKDITFTIQNIGDAALNLTGTPKVVVTGAGFSLVTDAPAAVAANGSVTFTVRLTTAGQATNYSGTVSIASNDADENPYNFIITGYGYDGTKALQTITFPVIPTKVFPIADFNPGATSDSGLTLTYTSSNLAVATIVSGKIHIIGAGTSNIKASQAGDAAYNPANDVTELLTVTPVIPPVGTNLIANPTFDVNTTGWSFANKNGATATLENVVGPGYTTKVAMVTVTNIGTNTGVDNAQFTYNRVFIEKGKTYIVSFAASATVARTINTVFIISASPYTQWSLKSGIPLTTTPTNLGPYNFISTFTGYVDLRFHFAGSGSLAEPVYIDNVSVVEDGIEQSDVTWTGALSTAYEATGNWNTNVVPYAISTINIPAGLTNYPVINTYQTISGAIIAVGASLTINSGKVLTNTGIIINTGTITNNGDLILESSATGTASLVSDTTVNNLTLQKYLTSSQRGWRLLSNPLASTTFSALVTASTITLGTGYTGEYLTAPGLGSWTSTNGTGAMENNKAYKVFITGKTGEAPTYATGPTNVTLVINGAAANTPPTQKTTAANQYYLVANPYTAPVSIRSIIAASTNLSNTVSYYNPTNLSNGTTDLKLKKGGYDYRIISAGAPGDANDVVIPPMGALFVKATSSGTINVPKTAIFTGTNNSGTTTHKTAQTKVDSTNDLKVVVSSGGTYYDTVTLRFKAAGNTGSNIDFGKLTNTIFDFYSLVGTQKMAVSELELMEQTIALGISTTESKSLTFKVAENTIPEGFEAVLVDNVMNTNTVLTPGTNYNFAIDSTPTSQGDARFAINLRTAGSSLGVNANELQAKIQVYPNPSRGEFNISNTLEGAATIEINSLSGQVIHIQKLNSGTTTIQTKSWAAGVYILKASNNGTQTTKKLIIQ